MRLLLRFLSWLSYGTGLWHWWSRFYRRHLEGNGKKSVTLPVADTWENLEQIIGKLEWTPDKFWPHLFDVCQSAEATWYKHLQGRPAGDCDDHAFLAASLIENSFNLSTKATFVGLLTVLYGIKGHTVCVFKYIDNNATRYAHLSNWYNGKIQKGFHCLENVVTEILDCKNEQLVRWSLTRIEPFTLIESKTKV